MKRLVISLLLLSGTLLGCAQNYFNIPAENFAEKVKVLGVAPIFVDADSNILHPQKELLLPLIADLNRRYEPLLVRKLQSTGNFYAVTALTDEPRQLFSTLMARRESRDDASIQYNKYFWKNDEIGSYIKKNRLDAVMVVVVSGLTKNSTIYSSSLLTFLETNYNFLTVSAQILDANGTVLWEYPNFRGQLLSYLPLANLQYPDFSESEANLSRKTEVRFKSLDGIRRTLELKKKDWLLQETPEPEVYGRLFDVMTSLIKHDGNKQAKGTAVAADGKPAPSEEQRQPDNATDKAPTAAPVLPPPQKNTVDAPVAPTATPNEIVPATEKAGELK